MRLLIALAGGLSACAASHPWGSAIENTSSSGRAIRVDVTRDGFVPNRIDVKRGDDVSLVFTRRVERTCAKEVIVELDDRRQVRRALPLQQPISVALHFERSGELGFTCGMKMLGGTINVR